MSFSGVEPEERTPSDWCGRQPTLQTKEVRTVQQSLLPLIVFGLLLAAASLAVAQEDRSIDAQNAPSMQEAGRRGMDPTKRVDQLNKQLSLTSDQRAKMLGILQQEQASMNDLRQDSSLSQQDRRSKMMDIRNTGNSQIRALLTEDQQQKWDRLQKSQGQHKRGNYRGSSGDDENSLLTNQSYRRRPEQALQPSATNFL
jgi:protein CpxP